jgi:hypothetical protein
MNCGGFRCVSSSSSVGKDRHVDPAGILDVQAGLWICFPDSHPRFRQGLDVERTRTLVIEIDRALQVCDLSADMVDACAAEVEVHLRTGGRAASKHGETLNPFSATE